MRKLLIALLAALLALCGTALADEGIAFDARTAAVTAATAGGDIVIPAEIDGVTVKALQYNVFNNDQAVTSVALPDTLEVIGSNCFFSCPGLTELTIPPRVAFIDYGCFSWNDNLKSVTFTGEAPLFAGGAFSALPDDFVCFVPDDQFDAYRAAIDEDVDVRPAGQNAVPVDWTAAESEFDFDAASGTITAYNGTASRVDVPATIGGAAVKAIGEAAFQHKESIYLVNLPEGLETIGAGAFQYSYQLYEVGLPSTLRVIGDDAFSGVWNSEHIDWPASLESIGQGAFTYANFTLLDFSGRTLSIGEKAFSGSRVEELYLDDSPVSIGSRAFEGSYLNYLCIDTYGLLDGIAPDAFAGASDLADLDLPWDSAQENQLAWRAFMAEQAPDCYVWINNPPDCDHPENEYAEYGTYPDGTLYLASYTGDAEALVNYHSFDGIQITGIGDGVFKGNQTLKKFRATHSDNFTTIGAEAFADSAVEVVDLYYTTTTIGAGAFRNCLGLTEITLPASVTSVGEGAFDGCDNLQRVNVLCDPAALPDNAFAKCASLIADPTGVVLPADASDEQVTRLSNGMGLPFYQKLLRAGEESAAFQYIPMPFESTDPFLFDFNAETGTITGYNGTDADVIVPREIGGVAVRAIGYGAFEACRDYTNTDIVTNQTSWTRLRSVVLPETVTEIADSAFSYCQQLETFVCYGPAVSTGKGTFMLCRSLKDVIFVNGVGMIDNYAFNDTPSFETFYSPAPLSYLGIQAFANSGVREFVVDAASIGNCAFRYCENLAALHFTGAVKQVDGAVLDVAPNLTEVCFEGADLSYISNDGIMASVQGNIAVRVPEGIDEENKARAGRILIWGTDAALSVTEGVCGRASAQLPDIEGIMAYYAENPYETDEQPIEQPSTLPDLPPLDAAAAQPYLGTWYGATMEAEGMSINMADLGMSMALTLNDDGTAQVVSDGETHAIAWSVVDGEVCMIVDGEAATAALNGDQLVMTEEGVVLTFTREAPEATVTEESPVIDADMAAFMGEWTVDSVEIGGSRFPASMLYDDNPTVLGIADGAVIVTEDGEQATVPATIENGRLVIGEPLNLTLSMHADGSVSAGDEDVTMYFALTGPAPEIGAQPEPAIEPEPAATEEPAPAVTEAPAAPEPAPAANGDIFGVKFVCTGYEVTGYKFDASMLGAEYAVVFEENGGVQFTMAGQDVPGLTWTQDGDALVIVYFDGTPLRFEPIEEGLQVDFYGMLMTYEPQA